MARPRRVIIAFGIIALAAAVPVASQLAGTRRGAATSAPASTRPSFKTFPVAGVRRPTVHVQLAQGYHAGQPMLIAVDEIVSVSPWATQRMESVTEPAVGVPNRKPARPAITRQILRGYNYGSRIETRSGTYFVSDRFEDLAVTLKEAGWGNVVPLETWVIPGDPATQPAAEPQPH